MSKGSSKPEIMSPTGPKTRPPEKELSQAELDQVAGGKVVVNDIPITKPIDKASPKL